MAGIVVGIRVRPWMAKLDGPLMKGDAVSVVMDPATGALTITEEVYDNRLNPPVLRKKPLFVKKVDRPEGVCAPQWRWVCSVRGGTPCSDANAPSPSKWAPLLCVLLPAGAVLLPACWTNNNTKVFGD
jgi:hypothetical protein